MNYGFFAHDIEKRRPSRENSLLWFVKCQAYIVEVRKEKKAYYESADRHLSLDHQRNGI